MRHVAFFLLRQMIQWCFVSSCIPSTRLLSCGLKIAIVHWVVHWLTGCLRACWGVGPVRPSLLFSLLGVGGCWVGGGWRYSLWGRLP